jgi:uncharacterized protein (TIGR03000 family)
MFGRFLAPTIATLTAALLCLPAAAAPPAGGYQGNYSGFHANPFGGYRGNFNGFYGNYNGNPGYYPGYFSSQGAGFRAYNTPSYSGPAPGYNTSYFTPYTLYSGTRSSYVSPAEQPPGPPPPDGTAAIGVHVPADAEVFFNGDPTKQTGEQREFITPTLPVGRMYEYEVRAHWKENGKGVDQTRTITVRANQRSEVDFTQPQQEKVGAPK